MEEEEYPMLALLGTNELRRVLTGSLSRAPYTLMHVIMSERGGNSSMLLVNDSITVSDLINIAWRIFKKMKTYIHNADVCSSYCFNIKIQKVVYIHFK